jgi:glycosyltransferase involved in cell wall biosynthesis
MNSFPGVSVVIPCFNGEKFLSETIQSVLQQSFQPLEILVVDDGSTDGSVRIAKSFGDRVCVFHQPNQGESVARNRGIELARGDFVAFLDADDIWHEKKLEEQLASLKPNSIGSFTGFRAFGESPSDHQGFAVIADDSQASVRSILQGLGQPFISSLLVRRDLPLRFPEWTTAAEDTVYLLNLVALGRLEPVSQVLAYYRQHASSQSHRPGMKIEWIRTLLRWIDTQPSQNRPLFLLSLGERVASLHLNAFMKRDWEQCNSYNAILKEEPSLRLKDHCYPEIRFPRWVYRCKDILDRIHKNF